MSVVNDRSAGRSRLQTSWDIAIDDFIDGIPEQESSTMKEITRSLADSLVARSPVDTGRFRSSWQCGINGSTSDDVEFSKDGGEAVTARVAEALSGLKEGDSVSLFSNCPYAARLEYGHSGQAPQGFCLQAIEDVKRKFKKN